MNKPQNTLLPPSSSKLEHTISSATTRFLPVELRKLWDPILCPAAFLPFLAWQYSVDRWDENWSEQTKRKVILDSFLTHKQKGTIYAIKRAVEPFGFVIKINEWFNTNQTPGTFEIDIGVLESGITEEDYTELTRIIEDAKCYSRQINGLRIILVSKGTLYYGATNYDGNELTVYPFVQKDVTTKSHTQFIALSHEQTNEIIYPLFRSSF